MDFNSTSRANVVVDRPGDTAPTAPRRRSSRKPVEEDVIAARAIVDSAPIGARPVDVALYFAALTDRNSRGHCFNAQWPVDYAPNPVILEFEMATHAVAGRPASLDLVCWCAAFVNWCLERTGFRGTGSAESMSFRERILEGAIATRGDIAVFGDVDASGRLMNTGHVGFWLQDYGDTVQIVAANHRHGCEARVSQAPVTRVRIDPRGRISRLLLGVVPIAAMQQVA